jgi:hypothetical protein
MDTDQRWPEVREMDVVPDEVAVRKLFDELTVGQPDAPVNRFESIRRRVRWHRITQAAGTLAAVGVATVIAVGIGTSTSNVAPNTGRRSVPAWALSWPDHRDGSVPQSVLDGAVSAWRHFAALDGTSPTASSNGKVIWYVGQKVANGQVVAVIFEAQSKTGPRLVAGWATASEVMHGQPGWKPGSSPWVLYDVAAPKEAKGLIVGLNVHGTSARPGRNPDNWIVVLAAPRVQDVGWTAPGTSSTTTNSQGTSSTTTEAIGMAPTVAGLAVWDAGQITGPVQVTQLEVHRRNVLRVHEYVGVPGSAASEVPQLAAPRPIRGRPGFTRVIEFAGQSDTSTNLDGIRGRLAVRARCSGGSPLRVLFGFGSASDLLGLSPSAERSRMRSLGSIACDDETHDLVTSVRLASRHNRGVVIINGNPATAYRVEIGTVAKR